MKKTIFLLLPVVAFIALWFFMSPTPQESVEVENPAPKIKDEESVVDYHASFLIFTNGTRRIFTNSKYHNLSQDVYIEASKPAVVHVKKPGITWGDFFKTLPMQVTSDCLITGDGEKLCNLDTRALKFFINGKQVEDFLAQEIKDGDWAMISYGAQSQAQIDSQLLQASKALP